MAQRTLEGVEIVGVAGPEAERVLTRPALEFVARLHREFNGARASLLERRAALQIELDAGTLPAFLPSTQHMRHRRWQVASAPADLQDRRVEITGPVDRKMIINALNSGANVFMADFEDSLSPTWSNVVGGQANLIEAIRRTLELTTPEGKAYRLHDEVATLLVRPRGWHLTEKHVRVDGEPISASLLDFGLYLFHNAHELMERGSGPYFYIPKLENHLEARLWNDVFELGQEALEIPRGTIRATVLIETILAAFEMHEILYELRDHVVGLNAGRWDYIFSVIKKFRNWPGFILPDRAQVTMTVPFMRNYTELLVQTCHQRGAHAIGGMAAFIPSRRDPHVNEIALAKVREDKEREAADGFDGTWVAHPDLVPIARQAFDPILAARPNQKDRLREEVQVGPSDLLDVRVPKGRVTREGVASNIGVALRYLSSWLEGTGAAAIFDLMEDAATAEIARAQLWQWIHHEAPHADGIPVTPALYDEIHRHALEQLLEAAGDQPSSYAEAADLLDRLVLDTEFTEFLTVPGYARLERQRHSEEE